MFNQQMLNDKYNNDSRFRSLVDMLYIQITDKRYTRLELKQAVHAAALKYEYRHLANPFIEIKE